MNRKEADLILTSPSGGDADPDAYISPVHMFHSCIKAFTIVFTSEEPPIIVTGSELCYALIYDFVDASGSGFGSTLQQHDKIQYRIGT